MQTFKSALHNKKTFLKSQATKIYSANDKVTIWVVWQRQWRGVTLHIMEHKTHLFRPLDQIPLHNNSIQLIIARRAKVQYIAMIMVANDGKQLWHYTRKEYVLFTII